VRRFCLLGDVLERFVDHECNAIRSGPLTATELEVRTSELGGPDVRTSAILCLPLGTK
jgi:hypothetical protein